jgi:beta-lactamase class A
MARPATWFSIAIALTLGSLGCTPADPPGGGQPTADPVAELRPDVEALIEGSGAEVAVGMRTLDGRLELLIEPDLEMHAASTMKVPVMIELFRRAEAGELSLEDEIPVTNQFSSIVDGSPYTMSADVDSEGELYAAIGSERSLRQLCEAMITWSSNLATNILIDFLGPQRIQQTTDELGAAEMHVLRGVEDLKAFEAGLSNSTTARALLVLFEKLGRGEVVSAAASEEMLSILRRQQFNEAIPAGLPAGTVVAHKTGNITRIHHDAALVESDPAYALVVLVRGIDSQEESAALIAEITERIHRAVIALPSGATP